MTTGVVWFRSDLRLGDNPAWDAATSRHDTVVPLFILDPRLWTVVGEQRRAQLGAHLGALDRMLQARGGRLRVEAGPPSEVVLAVAEEVGAEAVHVNGDVTPYAIARDDEVGAAVQGRLVRHDGRYVHAPGAITTADGRPYVVFTPSLSPPVGVDALAGMARRR